MSEYKIIGSDGGIRVMVLLPDGRKVQTTRSDRFDSNTHVIATTFSGDEVSVAINWGTEAELFERALSGYNMQQAIQKIIAFGGTLWGRNSYMVEFLDGSYYSMSCFYPEDSEPYYNGSAKLINRKIYEY